MALDRPPKQTLSGSGSENNRALCQGPLDGRRLYLFEVVLVVKVKGM
jgi:hypothetical protein